MVKCEFCKEDLEIGLSEKGKALYKVTLNSDKTDFLYELDEFIGNGESEYYCRHCGKEIYLDEKWLINKLIEKLSGK